MPRLVWLTDLHLNFADAEARSALIEGIAAGEPDHLLIGGDIAEAPTFVEELQWLAEETGTPIWFVLGNHDYYRSSIHSVRQQAERLTQTDSRVGWLPASGVVSLTDETALIGHSGWGDARAGDWETSQVILNDYVLIEELRTADLIVAAKLGVSPDLSQVLDERLRLKLNALGDESAAHLRDAATRALANHRHVFVLMHVPPFLEACWHEERLTDDNWAPHFVCQAAGEALREIMASHPDRRMTILCGHTHSGGTAQILPNLEVLTGEARYRHPAVQRVFDVSGRS